MPLEFSEIPTGEDFENFAAQLLNQLEFEILSAPGRGIDAGVDLIVRTPKDPALGISTVFLVQCKHLATSGRAVGLSDLNGISVSDLLVKHAAQGYLLITSTVASQSLQDHFNEIRSRTGKQLLIWNKTNIEEQIVQAKNPNLVQRYFPKSGHLIKDYILLPPLVPSWDTIVNTLHARAVTDIAQTIGQKYIPDLYVARSSLEGQVDALHLLPLQVV